MNKPILLLIINFSLFIINCSAQWTVQESGTTANLNSVYFTDSTHGWAVGDSGTILTYDGFKWKYQHKSTDTIFTSVYFIDQNNGFASGITKGSTGILFNTKDGGKNWSFQCPLKYIVCFNFPNKNIGYASGDVILKTNDSGKNWEINYYSQTQNFDAIDFINSDTGYVTGTHSVLKTTDGGKNWVEKFNAYGFGGNSLSFTSADTGHVAGIDCFGMCPRILRTIDGGNNWIEGHLSYCGFPVSIFFINKSIGYIVGDTCLKYSNRPSIAKTIDGGITWLWQDPKIKDKLLNSIYFVNKNNGWIVGDGGTILYTINGGVGINKPSTINNQLSTKIYPNPATDNITIEISGQNNINSEITITNITGKELLKTTTNQPKTTISTSNFPAGIYFTRIKSTLSSSSLKFIVTK